jgi:hypothetical protein
MTTLSVPPQSARLVKKAANRTPAVFAAKNLLMRKLKLLEVQNKIDSTDLDRYIRLFAEGLSEVQAQMIRELFMDHVSAPLLVELVDAVEE